MNRSSILNAILYCWAYILYACTLSLFLRYCNCCNRSISCGCAYKRSQLFTVREKQFIRRTISVLDAITYQLVLFSLQTGPSFSSEPSLGDIVRRCQGRRYRLRLVAIRAVPSIADEPSISSLSSLCLLLSLLPSLLFKKSS